MSLNTILATTPLTSTNYVLKATGTTIGNSLIWDDGTNANVGGTASLNKLTIQGGTFTAATSTSYALGVANGGGNDLTLGTSSTYGAIQTWSSKPLVLQGVGNNVLIGMTTDGSYKLDVTGAVRFSSTLLVSGAATFSSTATISSNVTINSSSLLRLGNSDNASTMQIWNSQSGAANNLLVYDNAASAYRFVISSSGNVGIGTSSPYVIAAGGPTLDLRGPTWSFIELGTSSTISGTNDIGYLEFMNGNNTRLATIVGSTDGSALQGMIRFSTSNSSGGFTERMRLYNTYAGTGYSTLKIGTTTTSSIILTGSTTTNNGASVTVLGPVGGNGVTDSAFFQIRANDSIAWVFQIDGSNQLATFYNNGSTWSKLGYQTTGGTWTNSDERRKTNIEDLEYGLKEVLQLKPKKFHFKHDTEVGNVKQKDMGFIAQEVLPIMPLAVDSGYDGEQQYYSMNYGNMIPTLVKAIQELQEQINILAK
jgi:hypothetical protein